MTRNVISLLFLTTFGLSQNEEIVEITKHIGFTLDAEENRYYAVFNDISNFESAQFFQLDNGQIESRISYLEFTRTKISRKKFDLKTFVDLQLRLNFLPPITKDIRESYRKNLTYLRTKEILKNIPVGQFVEVNHVNGKKIRGTLLNFSKDRLYIQTPINVKRIKITSMERITFREKIIDQPELQKLIYAISALIGFAAMEVWNQQTNPIWGYRWHNRFIGGIFGLLAGSELYDTTMILLSKKTKFGLSSQELEKLNSK